jgi:hypothetical protein
MPRDTPARTLERSVAGALRSAIKDHGPITAENVPSAVERILGNLKNARARTGVPAQDLSGELKRRYRIDSSPDVDTTTKIER